MELQQPAAQDKNTLSFDFIKNTRKKLSNICNFLIRYREYIFDWVIIGFILLFHLFQYIIFYFLNSYNWDFFLNKVKMISNALKKFS